MQGFRFFTRSIIIFSLFSFALPSFAKDLSAKRDPDIARAQRMINNKQYNEAIRFLSELIREHKDDDFDKYNVLLRQALLKLENYTVVANILLDLVDNNPEDMETVLRLSNELALMNAVRDPETEYFFAHIELTVRARVNSREMQRILVEGRALLDQKNYIAALRKYQTGFDLYQQQMYRDGFDLAIESRTRNMIANIDSLVPTLPPVINNFVNAGTSIQLEPVTTENRQAFINYYNSLLTQMDRLTAVKTNIAETSEFWSNENKKNTASGITNMNSPSFIEGSRFFGMAPAFILGRQESTQLDIINNRDSAEKIKTYLREGMLGVLDAIWKTAVDPLQLSFEKISDTMYNRAHTEAQSGNFAVSKTLSDNIRSFNQTPLALVDKWTEFTAMDGGTKNIFGQPVDEDRIGTFLKYKSMNGAIVYMQRAGELGSLYDVERARLVGLNNMVSWQDGRVTAQQALNSERAARNADSPLSKEVLGAIDSNHNDMLEYRRLGAGENNITYFNDSKAILESLGEKLTASELICATNIYTFTDYIITEDALRLEDGFQKTGVLASGVPLTLDDGQVVNAKYTREALAQWTEMETELNRVLDQSRDLLNEHQSERPGIAGNSSIIRLRSEAGNIADRLNRLSAMERSAVETARTNVERAENYEKRGNELITQARSALETNDFTAAHNNVEQASVNFINSLALQENPPLRRALLEVLVPLNVEITLVERQFVEREVRIVVNAARDTYFEGNYESAEQQLVRAERRWSDITTDPNDELNYWLTIVRGALSLRSGRTLPITAPLYPEISQLLSSAQKSYNDGIKLLNENQRNEGLQLLAYAKEKTQEVRLMFPINQDAGILELKIDQVIDPKAFEQIFQQRFVTAIAGTKNRSVQSYADLRDLSVINPNYPSMKAALSQAEVDMGIRPPPPDTRALRRSEELAAVAERLYRANVRSQFPIVLENVNEALRLNPNNLNALQLKEQVQTALGTSAVSAEDITTEQEYLRAVQELQNGNKVLALSIVQRLLQIPKNQSSVRINNLLQRIQSSM
ncbi:MAG: hypothetical protein Ta2B_10250 [Termitinemataceae bacterium]|nr:MAG: hypothetical protein Ta2B_10250 [Termitinemataceae bacterium]